MPEMKGKKDIQSFVEGLQELFPDKNKIWKDYDEEADVLYLNFRKPLNADDSIMKDDIIYHYDGDELVGVTVLNLRKNAGRT